jgi:hypothetical protein
MMSEACRRQRDSARSSAERGDVLQMAPTLQD